MYISAVIFVVLYAVDIALGYCIAGYIGSLFVAVALPIGIFIQLKLALFQADAIKLDDYLRQTRTSCHLPLKMSCRVQKLSDTNLVRIPASIYQKIGQ